jgi:cell division septum initiation protein DivIVA
MDILMNRVINPFSVYADIDATEGDGSDWKYCFVTEWLSEDEFKVKFPKAEPVDFEGDSLGDSEWVQEDKVRVAEYWTREECTRKIVLLSDGQVLSLEAYSENAEIFTAAGINVIKERDSKSWEVKQHWIGGNQLLDTVEWAGTYIPIVPVYGDEINVDGKRYYQSLIRHAKDSQRMFNYWRTTSTELVALAPKTPFIGKTGAFDTDIAKWNTANTKSHSFIEFDGDAAPQRQPFAGAPAGALQEALNASDDMKSIIGIYDASLGARSNETSGKAIMARQREGDVSTFHFIDNMGRAIRHAGRILVDLIPKVYDKPRVLRIIGEDKTPKNMQVNQQFVDDKGIEQMYDLTNGKYDVTVEAGASYTSRREEAVAAITELIRSYPPAAPILGDVMVKMMDFPDAEKISKRLAAMLPPQIQKMESEEEGIPPEAQAIVGQMQNQMQQMEQQMQQGMQAFQAMQKENEQLKQDKQAEYAKMQSDSQSTMAKINADLQKAEMDNKTRIQVAMISHTDKEKLQVNEDGEVEEKPEKIKRKRISIVAPSGQLYEGLVEDEEIDMPQVDIPQVGFE